MDRSPFLRDAIAVRFRQYRPDPTGAARPAPTVRLASFVVAVVLTCSAGAAAAINGGVDSPDTPEANATVGVNGGSGTLIAPDLVVTSGHSLEMPLPDMSPRFSLRNGPDPAVWHPIPSTHPVEVRIGAANLKLVDVSRRDVFFSPRTRLQIHDENRGELLSGDVIGLKARRYFLFVDGGRIGGELMLDGLPDRFGPWQSLTIRKIGGSTGNQIRGGDRVTLQALDGAYIAATRDERFPRADARLRQARHEFVIYTLDGRGPFSNDPIRHGGFVVIASTDSLVGALHAPYMLRATHIAKPGFDDIALLRLAEPVPEVVARPTPIKLRLDPEDPRLLDEYYNKAAMTMAGYGMVNGTPPRLRQQADIRRAQRETTNPGNDPEISSRYIGIGVTVAWTQLGDSGGSWFVQTPAGRRLVGITQQEFNRFLTPMFRGGRDPDGNSKPDVHAWFSMWLHDDDCAAVDRQGGLVRLLGQQIGASTACLFGGSGTPYAAAYPDATRPLPGEDCTRIEPAQLWLARPSQPEGVGSNAWILSQHTRRFAPIPGSWQQSYTRGAYLISYLQRHGFTQLCYSNRPDPHLVYFRR